MSTSTDRIHSVLKLNVFKNQLPFCCEETRKQSLQLPLKTSEDQEEIADTVVSLAAAKEISMDSPVGAVLSEINGIFKLKEKQ